MLLPVMLTALLPIVGKACNSIIAGCGRGCFGRHRLGTSHNNISWLLRPLTSNLLADPITLLLLLLQPLLLPPSLWLLDRLVRSSLGRLLGRLPVILLMLLDGALGGFLGALVALGRLNSGSWFGRLGGGF